MASKSEKTYVTHNELGAVYALVHRHPDMYSEYEMDSVNIRGVKNPVKELILSVCYRELYMVATRYIRANLATLSDTIQQINGVVVKELLVKRRDELVHEYMLTHQEENRKMVVQQITKAVGISAGFNLLIKVNALTAKHVIDCISSPQGCEQVKLSDVVKRYEVQESIKRAKFDKREDTLFKIGPLFAFATFIMLTATQLVGKAENAIIDITTSVIGIPVLVLKIPYTILRIAGGILDNVYERVVPRQIGPAPVAPLMLKAPPPAPPLMLEAPPPAPAPAPPFMLGAPPPAALVKPRERAGSQSRLRRLGNGSLVYKGGRPSTYRRRRHSSKGKRRLSRSRK
jgi:hypothetical protein